MRYGKSALPGFLFGVAIYTALVIVLQFAGFFSTLDASLQDKLLVPRPFPESIVIVAIDDKSIDEVGTWPWKRSLHAEMITMLSDAEARVIGYDVAFSEESTREEDEALETALQKSGRVILAQTPDSDLLSRFSTQAQGGTTSVITDHAGVVRALPLKESFALLLAHVPLPKDHEIYRIPFYGPPGTVPMFSFTDVLTGDVSPSVFKDKTVLVGFTASDLHDQFFTPFGHRDLMYGVEIQAHAVGALQEGLRLRLFPDVIITLFILVIGCVSALLGWLLPLRRLSAVLMGILILGLLIALRLGESLILPPLLSPLATALGVVVLAVMFRYITERRRRSWIQHAFAHYLSPSIIQKLVSGETPLALGGTKEELTILFSDIRGFTSLSEKLSPEALAQFLNEYLTAMTDIVLETDGVVDKYIGDAIMAFWGAPVPQKDHAIRAATTAIRMKARLSELQGQWEKEGKPRIAIGIGINTGNVVVGNMGSRQRFDYTVIGDAVNLASRLEGLTKLYGVTVIAAEETVTKLPKTISQRLIDKVAVKGKKEAVNIYEIDAPPWSDTFTKALNLYYARDFEGAAAILTELVKKYGDIPSAVFLERSQMFMKYPPEEPWNGVFVAKEK